MVTDGHRSLGVAADGPPEAPYRAKCECGWASDEQARRRDAYAAWRAHLAEVHEERRAAGLVPRTGR